VVTKMIFDEKKHLLHYDEMDNLHQEFVEIYNSLETYTAESYKNVLVKLFDQTKKHFYFEEILMDKYKYPRKREHQEEHNKVLAEMEYFIQKSDSRMGQMLIKSYYQEKLPDWFDLHLISMDSDLSGFLKDFKI